MARLPNPRTLRRKRRVLDLTLECVARQLRTNTSWLSLYENGWTPKREDALRRYTALARAYARLLDEMEKKSRAGRVRSKPQKEDKNENPQHDAA